MDIIKDAQAAMFGVICFFAPVLLVAGGLLIKRFLIGEVRHEPDANS